jgi:hypothetical protein
MNFFLSPGIFFRNPFFSSLKGARSKAISLVVGLFFSSLGAGYTLPLEEFLDEQLPNLEKQERVRTLLKEFLQESYEPVKASIDISFIKGGTAVDSLFKVTINGQPYALKLYTTQDGFDRATGGALEKAIQVGLAPKLFYPLGSSPSKNQATLTEYVEVHRPELEDFRNKESLKDFARKLKKFQKSPLDLPEVNDFNKRIDFYTQEAKKNGEKVDKEGFAVLPKELLAAIEAAREEDAALSSPSFQKKGLIHKNLNYNNILTDKKTGHFWVVGWEAGKGKIFEELAVLSLMNRFDEDMTHTLLDTYFGKTLSLKMALKGLNAFQRKYYVVLASWSWHKALEKKAAKPTSPILSLEEFSQALETGEWEGKKLPTFKGMIEDLIHEEMPLETPQDYQILALVELRAFFLGE